MKISAYPNPYQLLVEGAEDKRVIPELIERSGIPWEQSPKQYYVQITDCEGVENLLKGSYISSRFKSSGLKSLGIIIDADGLTDSHPNKTGSLLRLCQDLIPEYQWIPSAEGLIATNQHGQKLGVWIMPDNTNPGMLETLLLSLPPQEQAALMSYVQSVTKAAKSQHGAPFLEAHQHKAILHAWLAWQDPPGRQLHQAIKENLLSKSSPMVVAFVKWFVELYPPVTG